MYSHINLIENDLQLTHPNGEIFETFDSVANERDLIRIEKHQLEMQKQQLEIGKNKRDAKLRELGIDPDTL